MADGSSGFESGRRGASLTKIVLLLTALGLCIAGRRAGAWPISGWPMYSARWPEVPAPVVSAIELRAHVAPGPVRVLTPADLYPFERSFVIERLFEHAFDPADTPHRAADRAYLADLIERRLPGTQVMTVDGWRLEWEPDPMTVPPLVRSRPARAFFLGSFSSGRAR